MTGTLALGRIAGIRVRISYDWLLLAVLFVATLATQWFPGAAPDTDPAVSPLAALELSLLTLALFIASLAAHEAAHVLVARYHGLTPSRLTLAPLGGVSDLEQPLASPGAEFQIALAGPLVSLALAALAALLEDRLRDQQPLVAAVFGALRISNVLFGLVNLLPGAPLDGGRVLRALIWHNTGDLARATRITARVSQALALLLILWGTLHFFQSDHISGLWLVFLGLFIWSAGPLATPRAPLDDLLDETRVGEVMRPVEATVAPTATVQQAVDGYLLAGGMPAWPVAQGGSFVGLLTLTEVVRVPREHWPRMAVKGAMTPRERLQVASSEQPLRDVLPFLGRGEQRYVPVVQDERLVGMLAWEDLLALFQPPTPPGRDEPEAAPHEEAEQAVARTPQGG